MFVYLAGDNQSHHYEKYSIPSIPRMPCGTLKSAGYHAVSEVDVPLTYADYYYLEAILRLLDEIQ